MSLIAQDEEEKDQTNENSSIEDEVLLGSGERVRKDSV